MSREARAARSARRLYLRRLSEHFAERALPPRPDRARRMGDGAGRIEFVVQPALGGERFLGRGAVRVLESLVFSRVLEQARLEVGIRSADITDVERAVLMGTIQRVNPW